MHGEDKVLPATFRDDMETLPVEEKLSEIQKGAAEMEYLNTLDLEKEIEELEESQEIAPESFSELDADRLKELIALRNEFDHRQWHGGETLIPESEWQNYAEETAYDVGFVERGSAIASYVDWERWANDLTEDYASVELDGTTYYFRSW